MSAGVQICMPLQDHTEFHSLGNTISCFRSASSCFSSKNFHHHICRASSVVFKLNSALAKELEQQMEE